MASPDSSPLGISLGKCETVQLLDNSNNDRIQERDDFAISVASLSRQKKRDVDSMSEISIRSNRNEQLLEDELKRCKTQSAVFLLLNTKLRSHQTYGIGDSRLYTGLIDASQYVQLMCEKNSEAQDALRASGILNSLVETLVFFYVTHLEGHINPLNLRKLVKCWSQICSALWQSVDNPTNKRNQEQVLGKLIEKHDLKIVEFVMESARSMEKLTENYIIPIIQLFKALAADNLVVQNMMCSRKYFVPSLVEGMRMRLQQGNHDVLMWKSIDLVAWLLSMIIRHEKDVSQDETEDFPKTDRKKLDRSLCDLVIPCLSFIDKDRIAEKPLSVGIIMLFTSILGRNLDIVQRFISAGGEITLSQIFSSQPPNSVTNATRLAFQMLNVQKKRMRESGADSFFCGGKADVEVQSQYSKRSRHSMPYAKLMFDKPQPFHTGSVNTADIVKPILSTTCTPPQVVPYKGGWCTTKQDNFVQEWVQYTSSIADQGSGSKPSSGGSGAIPPVPPSSETESSITRYRESSTHDTHGFCPPPENDNRSIGGPSACRNGNGHGRNAFCNCNWQCPQQNNKDATSFYRNGPPSQLHYFAPPPNHSKKLGDTEFRFPQKRPRTSQGESLDSYSSPEYTEKEIDRESLISVSIPRRKMATGGSSSKSSGLAGVGNVAGMSSTDLSKILEELRPCEFVETDDHIVVFCTPPVPAMNDSNISEIRSSVESGERRNVICQRKANAGWFGSVFRWLFK